MVRRKQVKGKHTKEGCSRAEAGVGRPPAGPFPSLSLTPACCARPALGPANNGVCVFTAVFKNLKWV